MTSAQLWTGAEEKKARDEAAAMAEAEGGGMAAAAKELARRRDRVAAAAVVVEDDVDVEAKAELARRRASVAGEAAGEVVPAPRPAACAAWPSSCRRVVPFLMIGGWGGSAGEAGGQPDERRQGKVSGEQWDFGWEKGIGGDCRTWDGYDPCRCVDCRRGGGNGALGGRG